MSRIGKLPISVPTTVKVKADGARIQVEGPKGKLDMSVDASMAVEVRDGQVIVKRKDETRHTRGIHGLTRKLLANMIHGVNQGFSQVLEINGVGYRAEARGNVLYLTLGYSHPIAFHLPAGVTAKVERQVVVTLEAADRELLGQVAAAIRELRPPEPYKAKGVKYAEERIRRKAGKAAAGATR
jgi:large subunit ribosomal protein L6